jgi:hypothetical protein
MTKRSTHPAIAALGHPLVARCGKREIRFSTRHCEEERRGNPRYAERLCKLGIATLRSQ